MNLMTFVSGCSFPLCRQSWIISGILLWIAFFGVVYLSPINTLTCGSTRSGKTWSELKKLVEFAEQGSVALVVLDPHRDSLATPLLEHLVARGMQRRILFDRLSEIHRVIGWDFLSPSAASNALDRLAENEAHIRFFTDVLCRRRQVESLAKTPLIEEWLLNVAWLYVEQDQRLPLTDIQFAFDPSHPTFKRMLDHCMNREIANKFRAIARGTIRRSQFAAAARLIATVCNSPAFAVRCSSLPTFDLGRFLSGRGILAVEGGGASLSDDAMRTMMGTIALQTIQYVRTRPRPYPPVILAMDEATNAGLIGASGFETRALAECAKMGLAIHVLVQQLNFPTPAITESVLANTLVHEWFFNANPMVCRKAATDLGDRNYAGEIHSLQVGWRFVKDRHQVVREYVQPLEDPWGFPGLARKKAERALIEIHKRPEYRTPEQLNRIEMPKSEPNDNEPKEDENPNLGI